VRPATSRALLVAMVFASTVGCGQSHAGLDAASFAPDASMRDANPLDGGDYVPGDPDAQADLAAWQQYCVRMGPLVGGGPRSYYEVSCVRDFEPDPTCNPTIGELNHCLDVARSLYAGENLDASMIPACHDICHRDGG